MISAVELALNDPQLTLDERFQRCEALASLIEGGRAIVASSNDDTFTIVAAPMPELPWLWPPAVA